MPSVSDSINFQLMDAVVAAVEWIRDQSGSLDSYDALPAEDLCERLLASSRGMFLKHWDEWQRHLLSHPSELAEASAQCDILGHTASGFTKPMYPPLLVCRYCLSHYHAVKKDDPHAVC